MLLVAFSDTRRLSLDRGGGYIVFVAASIVTGHYWVKDGISGEVKRPCWSRNVQGRLIRAAFP